MMRDREAERKEIERALLRMFMLGSVGGTARRVAAHIEACHHEIARHGGQQPALDLTAEQE